MIQSIEFLSLFFFEIDKEIILITSIFLIMMILSFFLLISPDFLPKMMILIIEMGCVLLIFQISKDISKNVNFFLDLMQNIQGITDISLEYLDLIIKIEIQVKIYKTLSSMLLLINFFFTIIELI